MSDRKNTDRLYDFSAAGVRRNSESTAHGVLGPDYKANDVIIAKHSGFCFGVQRAADSVESRLAAARPGERMFTLGKLIHNDTYMNKLASRGVGVISESDIPWLAAQASVEAPVTVFIRAHGVTGTVCEMLERAHRDNPAFEYVDCTCPYVKKIHRIASENSGDGRCFILMGAEHHPEVVGIMSHVRGEGHVFADAEQLAAAVQNGVLVNLHKKTPVLAAQTTFNLSEWEKSQKKIKKLCTNALIFDTICGVTSARQLDAARLSDECDVMIVIGGKESSNTAKLRDICERRCPNTVLVEDADELLRIIPEKIKLISHHKVGIVAGASTPSDVIQEVYKTMSENTEIKAENFEEMLESSLKTLNTGDTVTGTITSVTDAELQLDLGAKVTGVITADQATDDPSEKLTSMFHVGDQIEAFVIRVSDVDGVATLSKRRVDSDKNWQAVVAAKDSGEILEGKVIAVNKGGVEVSVNSNRVFIPASQTGIPKDGDMSALLGSTVRFRIIEVRDQGKKAVGSIRVVLRDERQAREAEFWNSLEVGKQFTGKVKSMTSYGAFVDLGPADGMVHNTELSWKHIKSPAEVVSVGDELTVFVKSFDPEKKRISLGYKTEATEPWHVFNEKYAEGDVASVKIVSLTNFGAFAEIVDGVDGLIHISQLSTEKVANVADVVSVGQVVDAKIIAIDQEKKKVSLSIRALLEAQDDAESAEDADAVEAPATEAAE